MEYRTSDTIWEIREQPKRLLVVGGGPIGSELTQAFSYLGSQVTQVEGSPRIMVREDEDASDAPKAQIEASVYQIGAPRVMAERSLIARYGKLLLVSQALLKTLNQVHGAPAKRKSGYLIEAANPLAAAKPRSRPAFRRFS